MTGQVVIVLVVICVTVPGAGVTPDDPALGISVGLIPAGVLVVSG